MQKSTDSLPILLFPTPSDWSGWLEKNHETSPGIWMKFAKKNSGIISITYDQALDIALCFGWIDSMVNTYDEKTYVQKFTPRRAKSMWSKTNVEHVKRLLEEGKMHPAGLKEMERAQSDGRWQAAYDSPAASTPPDDFMQELKKSPKSLAFFETLNKTNRYAILWRLQTAKKAETRNKRMKEILEMLEKGEKFH